MTIPPPRPRRARTVGVVALIAAVAGLVAGAVLQFIAGVQLGGVGRFVDVGTLVEVGKQIDPATLPGPAQDIVNTANTVSIIAFVVWLLFVGWAIVQGIIAIASRRGRAWGVAALAVVAVGYLIVQVAYTVGLNVGLAPFV